MAKQQDFAYHLTNYLTVYLSGTQISALARYIHTAIRLSRS